MKFTQYAEAHVTSLRTQRHKPTWDDVAMAYDLGLTHAATRSSSQRKYLRDILQALRALNKPEPEEVKL